MTREEFVKLKVGDKVKIKDDANGGSWIPSMDKYRGKVLTIANIYHNDNLNYYFFDAYESNYYFEVDHIEYVVDEGLKVGDRVEVIEGSSVSGPNKGQRGTIKTIDNIETGSIPYAVEFDEPFEDGHTCGRNCKDSHGWWCADKEDGESCVIKKIEDEGSTTDVDTKHESAVKVEKFLFVEDGSVDLDELIERLSKSNPEICVVSYRQGSSRPELVEVK